MSTLAGPLFSVNNPNGRLDASDAEYVEAIHTNGPTLGFVGAGIGVSRRFSIDFEIILISFIYFQAPIGHANFWPNGGRSQPGCWTNTCSHGRAVLFYVESIQNNAFFGRQCPTPNDINASRCNITPGAW